MNNKLPSDISSYDLLKCAAVLLMIVDHVGQYFYPEENMFRVVGRFCVPMWFFLIGYAKSRDIGPKMWIAGTILVVASIPAGMYIFPLNIMFTMLFVRMLIDPVMKHVVKGRNEFWSLCVIMFFIVVPTAMVAEYGTQGIILAMFGYFLRHKEDMGYSSNFFTQFMCFCLAQFVLINSLAFGFDDTQFIVLCVGTLVVTGVLLFFKPTTYPAATKALPSPIVGLIKLGGRRTLEIYVAHLLLFKMLSVMNGSHEFLAWTWMAPS